MQDEIVIAEFEKNRKEKVVVSVRTFNGHRLLDLRVHYVTPGGEYRPGPKGLCLNTALLPDLSAAITLLRRQVDAENAAASREINKGLAAIGMNTEEGA